MKNLSSFQLVILGIFMFLSVGALVIFSATSLGGGGAATGLSGDVIIWGTLARIGIEEAVADAARQFRGLNVVYEEKNPLTFDQELVAALAGGRGPDAIVLPESLVIRHSDKVVPIPYESIPERSFRDTFVEAAEVFMAPEGVLGLPLLIDPIVMYWNRDILTSAGIAEEPRYWEEVVAVTPALTKRGERGTIAQSAIALGDAVNIGNASDILALLLLQSGDSIVSRGADKRVDFAFGLAPEGSPVLPADAAVRFFTQFGNLDSRLYTWNRGFSSAIEAFAGGQVALYLDFASADPVIRQINPHSNYDVALVPQIRDRRATTLGRVYALSLLRTSRNPEAAFGVISTLASRDDSAIAASGLRLSSARRDVIAAEAADPTLVVISRSALIARAWLDPFPVATRQVFAGMLDAVSGGRLRELEAISRAREQIGLLFATPF